MVRLEWTSRPTILVEGRDDKHALQQLLHQRWNIGYLQQLPVEIEVSETIQDPELVGLGSREKVETVARFVQEKHGTQSTLTAFEDREFRHFATSPVDDQFAKHFVEGIRFWTRGHSLENYVFERGILEEYIASNCFDERRAEMLDGFGKSFESLILHAATLTALSCELGDFRTVTSVINRDSFYVRDGVVGLNYEYLLRHLELRPEYKHHWGRLAEILERSRSAVDNSSISHLRWYCHGHLGLKVILIALEALAKNILSTKSSQDVFLRTAIDVKFLQLVDIWARDSFDRNYVFPEAIVSHVKNRIEPLVS